MKSTFFKFQYSFVEGLLRKGDFCGPVECGRRTCRLRPAVLRSAKQATEASSEAGSRSRSQKKGQGRFVMDSPDCVTVERGVPGFSCGEKEDSEIDVSCEQGYSGLDSIGIAKKEETCFEMENREWETGDLEIEASFDKNILDWEARERTYLDLEGQLEEKTEMPLKR
ncbi:Hypothetical predicted protein [Olea europaea subsp. europaea]|uniref:Uncharacterized protein n=1 Tax=Olea europaea subsp. europaea TaxID=158383 RepID=A0A8S0QLM8_OLEEU|nr:Hypothetical predicted protein [Olea europaea subsp. europaea]